MKDSAVHHELLQHSPNFMKEVDLSEVCQIPVITGDSSISRTLGILSLT
jgi:hypothetical protein